MTVNELIAKFNEMGLTGDEQIAVSAMGGIGASGKEIVNVSAGFDWNRGKILLHPKLDLQIVPSRDNPATLQSLERRVSRLVGLLHIAPVLNGKKHDAWKARREKEVQEWSNRWKTPVT